MKCAFCDRNEDDVTYLVAGPDTNTNNICDECLMTITEGIIRNISDMKEEVICSYCGRPDRQPHGIGVGGKVTICGPCTLAGLNVLVSYGSSYKNMVEKLEVRVAPKGPQIEEYLIQAYET